MNRLKILIVDDDKWVRDELEEFLTACNHTVFKVGLPSKAFEITDENEIDIVMLDIKLPEMDGLTVLERFKKSFPDMEIIMITGHGDMDSVIRAMRSGASDYFTKPFRLAEVQGAIERTRKFIDLNKKFREIEFNYSLLSKELRKTTGYQIVGVSSAMKSVIHLMSKVARSDGTTVLITGESGTGKEFVARGIHHLSACKDKHFYCVNISAISPNLFESELFGHKKGSFTGASEDKIGWFEIANNSTLFLDEICELDLNLQAKLLRVLEEGKIIRVGSRQEISVHVRVIAATNKNIEQLVSAGKFRLDLYHRLNVFRIHIPSLQERKEDIPLLVKNFAKFFSAKMNKPFRKIDTEVMDGLMNYTFPGNVRELKNMVERAVILCEEDKLSPRYFSIFESGNSDPSQQNGAVEEPNLDLEKNLESTEKN